MKKVDARRLKPRQQRELRRRVVAAVVDQDRTQVEVGEAFGVPRQTISGWVALYRKKGAEGLESRRRGPRRSTLRLSSDQERRVREWIYDRYPDRLGLRYPLWSRQVLQVLLVKRFEVRVSLSTAGRYLGRWGITPPSPQRLAQERDPAVMGRWLDDEYPLLRRQAKREGATIWWGAVTDMLYGQDTGSNV